MNRLNAFHKLSLELQERLKERVLFRKNRFLNILQGNYPELDSIRETFLIVGDRPAPSAPDDPDMQFTPFGALWNSSLYINLALEKGHIDETRLAWINSADFDNNRTSYDVLKPHWPVIISLGGNASRWLYKSTHPVLNTLNFSHPAYWKRFHSKKSYPLIEFLQEARCIEPNSGSPEFGRV